MLDSRLLVLETVNDQFFLLTHDTMTNSQMATTDFGNNGAIPCSFVAIKKNHTEEQISFFRH